MADLDPIHGAPNLPGTTSSPANADAAQIAADASAEAERLLHDLCGIKKPVLSAFDQPPVRPAVGE